MRLCFIVFDSQTYKADDICYLGIWKTGSFVVLFCYVSGFFFESSIQHFIFVQS